MPTTRKTPARKAAAPKSENLVVTFEMDRETKGTFRFAEVTTDDNPAIGSLYIKKGHIPASFNPESGTLTVTVEFS